MFKALNPTAAATPTKVIDVIDSLVAGVVSIKNSHYGSPQPKNACLPPHASSMMNIYGIGEEKNRDALRCVSTKLL
jgi:hypothetical protein